MYDFLMIAGRVPPQAHHPCDTCLLRRVDVGNMPATRRTSSRKRAPVYMNEAALSSVSAQMQAEAAQQAAIFSQCSQSQEEAAVPVPRTRKRAPPSSPAPKDGIGAAQASPGARRQPKRSKPVSPPDDEDGAAAAGLVNPVPTTDSPGAHEIRKAEQMEVAGEEGGDGKVDLGKKRANRVLPAAGVSSCTCEQEGRLCKHICNVELVPEQAEGNDEAEGPSCSQPDAAALDDRGDSSFEEDSAEEQEEVRTHYRIGLMPLRQ